MALKRSRHPRITVDYDEWGDVLYLASGDPVPAYTDEDDNGLGFRFSMDGGQPCGVTVLGYKAGGWSRRRSALAGIVGEHLHIQASAVRDALESIELR